MAIVNRMVSNNGPLLGKHLKETVQAIRDMFADTPGEASETTSDKTLRRSLENAFPNLLNASADVEPVSTAEAEDNPHNRPM